MTDVDATYADDSRDSVEGALVWLCAATVIWVAAFVLALGAGLNWLAGAVGILGFLTLVPEFVSMLSRWGRRPRRQPSPGYLRAAIDYRGWGVWAVYTEVAQFALVLFFAITR